MINNGDYFFYFLIKSDFCSLFPLFYGPIYLPPPSLLPLFPYVCKQGLRSPFLSDFLRFLYRFLWPPCRGPRFPLDFMRVIAGNGGPSACPALLDQVAGRRGQGSRAPENWGFPVRSLRGGTKRLGENEARVWPYEKAKQTAVLPYYTLVFECEFEF